MQLLHFVLAQHMLAVADKSGTHCLRNTSAVGRAVTDSTCTSSQLTAVCVDIEQVVPNFVLSRAEWLVAILAKHDVNGGHCDSHLHGDKLGSCDHGCT